MASAIAPPAAVAGPLGSLAAGKLVASWVVAIPAVAAVRPAPARARGEAGRPNRRGGAGDRHGVAGPRSDDVTPDPDPGRVVISVAVHGSGMSNVQNNTER
jgi:hypothetical protein